MINVNDFDFDILKNSNLQTVTTRTKDNKYIEYYNTPFAFDIETRIIAITELNKPAAVARL